MILRRPSDSLVLGFSPSTKCRVAFADTTETSHAISDAHGCGPASEYVLAGILASTALMGADVRRPGESLGVRFDCDGLVAGGYAEIAAGGAMRGYMRRKRIDECENDPAGSHERLVGDAWKVQAYFTRPPDEPDAKSVFRAEPATFRGLVEAFFLESFQIPTWANVGVRADASGVTRATGFLVQCMPDGKFEEFISRMERYTSEETLAAVMDDPVLETMREVLDLPDLEIGASTTLEFRCSCSRERSRSMLAGLPLRDLAEMAASGATQSVTCHFCGTTYDYPPEELRSILAKRKKG